MELSIGTKLRTLRRGRDLTQEEVAAHLSVLAEEDASWNDRLEKILDLLEE